MPADKRPVGVYAAQVVVTQIAARHADRLLQRRDIRRNAASAATEAARSCVSHRLPRTQIDSGLEYYFVAFQAIPLSPVPHFDRENADIGWKGFKDTSTETLNIAIRGGMAWIADGNTCG